jgi:hypothetical protein
MDKLRAFAGERPLHLLYHTRRGWKAAVFRRHKLDFFDVSPSGQHSYVGTCPHPFAFASALGSHWFGCPNYRVRYQRIHFCLRKEGAPTHNCTHNCIGIKDGHLCTHPSHQWVEWQDIRGPRTHAQPPSSPPSPRSRPSPPNSKNIHTMFELLQQHDQAIHQAHLTFMATLKHTLQ